MHIFHRLIDMPLDTISTGSILFNKVLLELQLVLIICVFAISLTNFFVIPKSKFGMLMWSFANDILKRPVCTFLGEVQQSETSPSSHFTSHSENNGSLCRSAVSTKFMFLLLSVLSKVVPKYSTVECSCVPYSCHVREEGKQECSPCLSPVQVQSQSFHLCLLVTTNAITYAPCSPSSRPRELPEVPSPNICHMTSPLEFWGNTTSSP